MMKEKHPEVRWPLEYRTVAADDIYLSPAYRRDTVAISAHQAADIPQGKFFADVEAIFRQSSGPAALGKDAHPYRRGPARALSHVGEVSGGSPAP